MITRILKLRPLLWIAAILLLAYLVSFTWERQTSYDDGGLGTLSFLIVTLFSMPGEFLGLGFATSVLLTLAFLVLADVVISRNLGASRIACRLGWLHQPSIANGPGKKSAGLMEPTQPTNSKEVK